MYYTFYMTISLVCLLPFLYGFGVPYLWNTYLVPTGYVQNITGEILTPTLYLYMFYKRITQNNRKQINEEQVDSDPIAFTE